MMIFSFSRSIIHMLINQLLKWSPSFFKTITNILDGQLLTNKIEIIKLFGVLGGRKDGF